MIPKAIPKVIVLGVHKYFFEGKQNLRLGGGFVLFGFLASDHFDLSLFNQPFCLFDGLEQRKQVMIQDSDRLLIGRHIFAHLADVKILILKGNGWILFLHKANQPIGTYRMDRRQDHIIRHFFQGVGHRYFFVSS